MLKGFVAFEQIFYCQILLLSILYFGGISELGRSLASFIMQYQALILQPCLFMPSKQNKTKTNNASKLLEDFLAYNISLISCNSHKENLFQKYIHTLKTCFDVFTHCFTQHYYFLRSEWFPTNKFIFSISYLNILRLMLNISRQSEIFE